jgi:hypothetical protein
MGDSVRGSVNGGLRSRRPGRLRPGIIGLRAVMGKRTSRKSVASARGEGLRDERKALALRYTVDADEALRREALATESRVEHVADTREPGPPAQPEREAARYVIQVNAIRFWWRWAVFEDLSVGDDPALALRSADAVVSSSLPYWSARSARRAAERAVRQAIGAGPLN